MARAMNKIRSAKYQIGQVVRHRLFPFRGVVFDVAIPPFSLDSPHQSGRVH